MATSGKWNIKMEAISGAITERRERTFLVLAGIFLSAMTLLNVVSASPDLFSWAR